MSAWAEQHLRDFVVALRRHGLSIPPSKYLDYLRALETLPLRGMVDLYWAARLTLLTTVEDRPDFDRVFKAFFEDGPLLAQAAQDEPPEDHGHEPRRDGQGGSAPLELRRGEGTGRAAAADDLIGRKRLAAVSPNRRALADAIARRLRKTAPQRRSRRLRPARRGVQIDYQATLRQALRYGGEPMVLRRRHRPLRPRKLLIAADVSGSMKGQLEDSLLFAHAALRALPCAEAFTFGSRLTRVTEALSPADPDRAITAVAERVADLDGGTRLGATLGAFLSHYRHSATARGAVVLFLSDGLERGDPTPLIQAVARLGRLAHRLVWLTPLMRSAGWRPQTRAMRAIEHQVDRIMPAAGFTDLAAAVAALPSIVRRGGARSVREGGRR